MRALLVALVVLPLAGCVGALTVPPTDDAVPATAALTMPWDLVECRIVSGWVGVDPARLAPYMPEGFAVEVGGVLPIGVAAGPEQALLGMEIFHCAQGTGLDGEVVPEMTYGSWWVPVVPPEHMLSEDAEDYYGKWDVVMPDAARRERFAAAGATVHDGAAMFEPLTPAGLDGPFVATMTMGDVGELRFTVTPDGRVREGNGFVFREFTPTAEGGIIVWNADYENIRSQGGRGHVEVPAGSMAADVIGDTRATAGFVTGVWTFRGDVTLPSR